MDSDNLIMQNWPRQKLPYSKKTDQWRENCVKSVIKHCKSLQNNRRSPSSAKQRNYNLLNNRINKSDFEYTLNPFDLRKDRLNEFQLPASLQPYDVASPTFMLLFGEEAKRMFNPVVRAINSDVASEKLQKKKEYMLQALTSLLSPKLTGEDKEPVTPEQVAKYMNYSVKDARESVSEKLLQYYKRYLRLSDLWMTGWKDALVSSEEIYRIDDINGGPRVARVNPLQIEFVLPSNTDYIDYADMIHEQNYMTLSQIVDEFYESLTEDQIKELEETYQGNIANPYKMVNLMEVPEVDSIYHFASNGSEKGIPVHRVRWKSFKKQGSWHYMDPDTGEMIEETVDEYFKIDKEDPSQYIEWFWISEYWEGTLIGNEDKGIFVNVQPRRNQFRSMDNLSSCKSGYVGTLYSALNSQAVSLMDRMVPWIYLYLIIWYNTELLISTNIGKVATIDTSLIPDNWEPEKWLYYIKSMKIAFVNSYNEGKKAERYGDVNMSTQTKSLDLEMGNSIQYNIRLLEFIEEKIEMTSGISRQRKGSISSSELVGNTERAVQQSSNITEEWFRVHNYTKLRVCEALIEVAKDCLINKKKQFQYISDDMSEILFEVDGDEFNNADYGVFISDSIRDQEALQAFKENLRFALQSDKLSFSQIADVFNSESIADLKNKTLRAEQERQQQGMQESQMQQKMQQDMLAKQEQMEQLKLEMQKYIADSTNETKIRVAEIGVFSRQENLDQNGDGIPDPMQIAEHALAQQELHSKHANEVMKLRTEKELKQKELSLKERELASKERLETEKLKVEKQNMANDLQIARINAKNKPKPTSKK